MWSAKFDILLPCIWQKKQLGIFHHNTLKKTVGVYHTLHMDQNWSRDSHLLLSPQPILRRGNWLSQAHKKPLLGIVWESSLQEAVLCLTHQRNQKVAHESQELGRIWKTLHPHFFIYICRKIPHYMVEQSFKSFLNKSIN